MNHELATVVTGGMNTDPRRLRDVQGQLAEQYNIPSVAFNVCDLDVAVPEAAPPADCLDEGIVVVPEIIVRQAALTLFLLREQLPERLGTFPSWLVSHCASVPTHLVAGRMAETTALRLGENSLAKLPEKTVYVEPQIAKDFAKKGINMYTRLAAKQAHLYKNDPAAYINPRELQPADLELDTTRSKAQLTAVVECPSAALYAAAYKREKIVPMIFGRGDYAADRRLVDASLLSEGCDAEAAMFNYTNQERSGHGHFLLFPDRAVRDIVPLFEG